MAFAKIYDSTTPAGTDDPKQGDDRIRETKAAIAERLGTMLYGLDAAQTNELLLGFIQLIFTVQAADKAAVADKIIEYGKDVNSACQLFGRDENGVVYQLTGLSRVRAYLFSNQALLVAGGAQKIQFNTENFDLNAEYDKDANYRFTAKTAGYYFVRSIIDIVSNNAGDRYVLYIFKNGASYQKLSFSANVATYSDISITDVVYLAADDYIEIFIDLLDSNCTAQANSDGTSLAIHKLS